MNFFEKLQHIDRRIMYLLLALVIAAPLIWQAELPIIVSPAVQGAYDAVEAVPPDQIAVISIVWDSGTVAENRPQTEALMRHMFMRNKKFAVLAFAPQGSKMAYDSGERIAEEMHKEYGVDWVHWGYKPGGSMPTTIISMARDIPGTIGKDANGTPISQIPMMKGIKDIHDVGLIAEMTPSGTLEYWIAYVYGPYRTPLVYGPTAVMAPEGFNPLDAGQIKGMLTGMKGAAEYEKLLGRKDFATRAAGALSTSHVLIILLIVAGNIGYVSAQRRRRREEAT
jgi:hypothetical protein